MTQPQRKIVGKFTENFEYTVNGEPLSHPVWAPEETEWAVDHHSKCGLHCCKCEAP